jgi:GGDEF domain-containing protein
MSLQGPLIVVAESPATAQVRGLVQGLVAAGAFPIIETNWADAPTAFVSVKPSAVVIAEPGPPLHESSARMLCLQIATAEGPIVPTVAIADDSHDVVIPVALTADVRWPVDKLIARLQSAMRVRALHAAVLRRIELFAAQDGQAPKMPVGDALDDATVLIVGRGPLYPALGVAIGEQAKVVGVLSVEAAAKQLNERDIDAIVIGDGFSPRMVEAFLTMLAQEARFRDIPIAVVGDDVPRDLADCLTNLDQIDGAPERLVARLVPLLRLRAFEARLKRMLKTLDAEGMFDPDTGLLTRDSFWRELATAVADAADRSHALSVARFSFDGPLDERARLDGARLLTRLVRNIDFACRDDDGALLVAFTQTDLRGAHVVARRIAGTIKNAMTTPHFNAERSAAHDRVTANVTLAGHKNADTLDSLMQRVIGRHLVAAE